MKIILKNKKKLCILLNFNALDQYVYQKKFFLNTIPKFFKEFYFIDISFLYGKCKKTKYKHLNLDKKIYKFYAPKNYDEFLDFSKDTKMTLIWDIGRSWTSLKFFFFLKNIDCNIVQISNIGNAQGTEYKNYKSFLKQKFFKALPHKLLILFSFFCFIPRIDIKFFSNKKYFLKIRNNIFNNFFSKFGLHLYAVKKFILINALAYDEILEAKKNISQKYIVMLNTNINHKDAITYSGKLPKKKVDEANTKLKNFLERVSKNFKKKVVICLHPSSNLDLEKKNFKGFKVVQYQTKKYIRSAWLVFLYETSSVVDAFILNKKIVALENTSMGQNWVNQSNNYPSKAGILKINIDNGFDDKNKNLLLKLIKKKKNSSKYNKFVSLSLIPDSKRFSGSFKILKIVKQTFF